MMASVWNAALVFNQYFGDIANYRAVKLFLIAINNLIYDIKN